MILTPARLLVTLFAAAALPAFAQNVAVVNGKPIPSSRLEAALKQVIAQSQGQVQDNAQVRNALKEQLITREILAQEADKLGLSNSADVKAQFDLERQSIVLRALVGDFVKKNPVSDAEIAAEYDKFKAQMGDKEYKARHILVEKEEDAKTIIAKLKSGAKFDELAKQSKDTGSASNGGDLDWNSPAAFVKPFSDAMVALQKGQLTETPVKTQHGYHVIRLDDVRAAKVPSLEELKPQIIQALQERKVQAYQEELRKKAKIQ
jgi:peptidyl-prolyl cis-trans isomerase C